MVAASAVIAGAGLATSVLGMGKSNKSSRQAAGLAAQDAAMIRGMIPKNMTTNFPTGSFNFSAGPDGQYTSTLVGGVPHIRASTIKMPDFGGLHDLSDKFGDLGTRFGELGEDRDKLGQLLTQIGDLKPMVAPGFSALRDARLGAIEDARRNTVGNLRDDLGRRKVTGSSFYNDAISRTEAEYARQASDAEALSTLEELEATSNLLKFEDQVITHSAAILEAELNGVAQTLAQQSQMEQFEIGTRVQVKSFNAAQRQNAAMANQNADAMNMAAAFQGAQQALDYTAKLTSLLSGANQAQSSAWMNNANNWAEVAGAGAGVALGGFGGKTPSQTTTTSHAGSGINLGNPGGTGLVLT